MKIYVIGTRGFPNVQGGVEKHCESLYPAIAARGHEITVFRRTPYLNQSSRSSSIKELIFRDLWTSKNQNLEAVFHSFWAAFISLIERPDLVHIHNIGPALVLPLLKLGGVKTIVTYHSANYEHSKWNLFAKRILMFGEKLVLSQADAVIFVAQIQFRTLQCRSKYYIPNGVCTRGTVSSFDFVKKVGAEPGQYILAVARFSQEKGLHDLVAAYRNMNTSCKLVIAGSADHESQYSRNLHRSIAQDHRIILTGYITGEPLDQVFSHARLFVLPSYHEGLPIALLEAMSFGLSVLVSDIPATLEVGLEKERYFKCGDVKDLREKMHSLLNKELSQEEIGKIKHHVAEDYNWQRIVAQTVEVYKKVLSY